MINDIYLKGNIGKEPEVKTSAQGKTYLSFDIAVKQGPNMTTAWYHVFYFQAPNFSVTLKKGDSVVVRGRIQTDSWNNPSTGKTQYTTRVLADDISVIDVTRYQRTAPTAESYKDVSRRETRREMQRQDDIPVDDPNF